MSYRVEVRVGTGYEGNTVLEQFMKEAVAAGRVQEFGGYMGPGVVLIFTKEGSEPVQEQISALSVDECRALCARYGITL